VPFKHRGCHGRNGELISQPHTSARAAPQFASIGSSRLSCRSMEIATAEVAEA
jgi:hypothetical protein